LEPLSGQAVSTRQNSKTGENMDKDRVKGMAQQGKGAVKEAVGKMVGDEKLKTEGRMDKAEGKIRNAIGGAKDALRDAGRGR
jgi:uncharacterized protein YjbJ (UPF0337 family)